MFLLFSMEDYALDNICYYTIILYISLFKYAYSRIIITFALMSNKAYFINKGTTTLNIYGYENSYHWYR